MSWLEVHQLNLPDLHFEGVPIVMLLARIGQLNIMDLLQGSSCCGLTCFASDSESVARPSRIRMAASFNLTRSAG